MMPPAYQLAPIDEQRGGDPMALRDEVYGMIERHVTGQERSLQVEIGPSEVGTPCDRCLGHKLAQQPELPDVGWLAFIGTCVHKELAELFTSQPGIDLSLLGQPSTPRWLVEQTVHVGDIDGRPITGHSDLFDRLTCSVIDHKVVGPTTLRKAKSSKGPGQVYRAQGHLYGRGFVQRGLQVDTVHINYLPRNAMSVRQGVWWSEPYDEQIALDALKRADALARAIRIAGWDNVRDNLAADPDCPNCHRYPMPDGSRLPRPGRSGADKMTDLLGAA